MVKVKLKEHEEAIWMEVEGLVLANEYNFGGS